VVVRLLWFAWLLYWIAAAGNVKRSEWREPWATQIWHRSPIWVAAFLLFARVRFPWILGRRVWPPTILAGIVGIVVLAAGLALSVWARVHLGRNWSGRVTIKADHSLIRTGPYRVVRHPIYTGLVAGVLSTAITVGEWRAVVAFVLVVGALIVKLRVEERRMASIFPEYDRYRRETAALVPFVY